MGSTRRGFLQVSGAAASALTLGPLVGEAARVAAAQTEDATARSLEARLVRARPVPLDRVRLLGGPLKNAQDLTAKYLLELDPDRMMAYYRLRAGLPQKGEPYRGWDGPGHNLTGHIAGHHLSAVSLMYVATGDARFKERADYLVADLKVVQDAQQDGYLSALENGREAFAALSRGEIRSAAFDLNGLWSPWYVLHKTFAGLRDAYRYTGNRTALEVEVKFAQWAGRTLAPLTDVQIQHMLNTEHGGMNEVLADLYVDTSDPQWLALSRTFEHRAFTDALKHHQDNLNGKHGNCQIPKMVGSAARYGYTGDAGDLEASAFFWDRVVQHHSYASGGHGLDEYFGPADQFSRRVDGRTCESCNVYNMLKLTRRLFSFRPDPLYADFQERALFNHVLASIDPVDGRTCYMVPVGHAEQQEYQVMLQSFTCCVGTGMENHALHGFGIYYESDDTVWVNLFVPSTAESATLGGSLRMETGFPDGDDARMTFTLRAPKTCTVAVRRPGWAGDGFVLKVNGTPVDLPTIASLKAGDAGGRDTGQAAHEAPPSSYVRLARTWKTGDTIEIVAPKSLRLEPTPDDHRVTAIMWGPLSLAATWGPRREGRGAPPPAPVPVLVSADRPVTDWVVPAGTPGDFKVQGVARTTAGPTPAADVALSPFYRTYERTYGLYFDVLTPAEFDERVAALAAERERVRKLEAATVGRIEPGDVPGEKTANYQSDPADRAVQRAGGRTSRSGTGWFSYELGVDGSVPTAVVVTYFNPVGVPATGGFDIQVDGTAIAKFEPNAAVDGFFDRVYPVPADLVRGKSRITVRFQATGTGRIAPIFGVRTIRADLAR